MMYGAAIHMALKNVLHSGNVSVLTSDSISIGFLTCVDRKVFDWNGNLILRLNIKMEIKNLNTVNNQAIFQGLV